MNNLLNFFVKHSSWFVFIIYVIASCVLLFRDNPYQQSVYLTSANSLSATVYEGMSTVTDYFHLKGINDDLQQRNALLEQELVVMRDEVNNLRLMLPDTAHMQPRLRQFDYVLAHVISNSIAQTNNYITINRGSDDGVKPEMGVVDQNGVVGIVNVVGRHSARVISLLNPHMRLSCKLRGSEYFGSMVWDGKSPQFAVLEELPKHLQYSVGDTIVTSGYSAVFPEGIIVGTVDGRAHDDSESFVSLKVRLTTNFSQLSTVRVMTNNLADELRELSASENTEQSAISTPKPREDKP